ncbi:flavin reductase [Herbaspirillum sp. RTI4]|uniref:flavin reductase n=1 Tax=Herbaspirillum sp. RTI4 TaxID=3048640 RepID=UPI002AB4F7E2|nr:flavin reductase [Herbaspirillum sp. RTI4]MDY7579259.1 flavin reductase [Herbaspirillum sp. RTI4]MEA9982758.1 flavin reductase [Herbaspirillum sp. RTI4]
MENTANNSDNTRTDFRNAMARMGAAVNIITSNGETGRCGMTATAVCSVSDTPPSVLVCLNRSSAMNAVFKANGVLCINVLSADQESHARDFAGMTGVPMEQRFAAGNWREGILQLPLLGHALANLQGRIISTEEVGSHTVMIVAIEKIDLDADGGDSLVYFDRLFHRVPRQQVAAEQTAARDSTPS